MDDRNEREQGHKPSVWERFTDWLADAVGSFVRDVRQRVVERGWFGETVTPRSQSITIGSVGESASEKEWFARFFGSEGREGTHVERDQQDREQHRGIER